MRRKSVLIVDDDDAIGTALTVRLNVAGYDTAYEPSGRGALERLEHSGPDTLHPDVPHPDVIVLDVRMPDLDGIEVCTRLRASPKTRRIPVIFLTANTQCRDRSGPMSALGDAVLTKPYDGKRLIATIESLTQRSAVATVSEGQEVPGPPSPGDRADHRSVPGTGQGD